MQARHGYGAQPNLHRRSQAVDDMGMVCALKNDRATLHLHGGNSPWISDGTPHQWVTPADEMTTWPEGVSVVDVPDMVGQAAIDAGYLTVQQITMAA